MRFLTIAAVVVLVCGCQADTHLDLKALEGRWVAERDEATACGAEDPVPVSGTREFELHPLDDGTVCWVDCLGDCSPLCSFLLVPDGDRLQGTADFGGSSADACFWAQHDHVLNPKGDDIDLTIDVSHWTRERASLDIPCDRDPPADEPDDCWVERQTAVRIEP